jgi:hypothetical protein
MSYNGYSSYEAWNVALWIDNTYELQKTFNHIVELANDEKIIGAKDDIVTIMMGECFNEFRGECNPDGVMVTRERIEEYVSMFLEYEGA